MLIARASLGLCAATVSLTLAGPASGGTCHAATYAYAGLASRVAAPGVAATIVPTAAAGVRDGHVAGWVGVGGYGVGPNGTNEWLQIGVIAFPNKPAAIYYEVTRPGRQPVQRTVRARVAVGERHRFAVHELARRPNWWRVSLDGRPVSPAVLLPRSHDRLTAQMTGESYAGLSEGACNLYSFKFDRVSVAASHPSLRPLAPGFELFQDPNYVLQRRSRTSFVARSTASIP